MALYMRPGMEFGACGEVLRQPRSGVLLLGFV